jgi:hypothetical protein
MKIGSFVSLTGLVLVSGGASAVDFTPSASVSGFYSDNIFGAHNNPRSEEGFDVAAGISLQHRGPHLDINSDVGIVRREFAAGTTQAETLPQGRASIFLSLVPDRVVWEIDDRLGRTTSRSFAALADADRENVNILRTGPDIRLDFVGRNAVILSGRAAQSSFQESDVDSRRYSGSAAVAHNFSPLSYVGATYERELVNYTSNRLYPSTRTDSVHLNYTVDTQRTFFATEFGVENSEIGNQGRKQTPHVLVSLQRRTSPRWTMTAEYRHEFSDAAESLRPELIDRFSTGGDLGARVLALTFKGDVAYLMAVRSSGRLMMAWQVGSSREDYEPAYDQFDRKNYTAQMQAYYALNSYWGINSHLRWVSDNSFQTTARVKYTTAGLGVSRQVSRSLTVSLDAERSHSDSSDILRRFTENRVTLNIGYAPPGRGRAMFRAPNEMRLYERAGMPRPDPNAQQQQRPAQQ